VNFKEDAEYRKRLSEGFLHEARLNFGYRLWRSCVDNSQLSIENAGKMIIALFEPVEKSHNPSHQLKRLVEQKRLGNDIKPQLDQFLQILGRFGIEEHFMTEYGDEATRTDPWNLFGEEDAREALDMAEKCFRVAKGIYLTYLQETQ